MTKTYWFEFDGERCDYWLEPGAVAMTSDITDARVSPPTWNYCWRGVQRAAGAGSPEEENNRESIETYIRSLLMMVEN